MLYKITICTGKLSNTDKPDRYRQSGWHSVDYTAMALTRTPDQTLTDQLAERFAERIRTRLLPAGAKLPSVRACAHQQGVSAYTVVAAYDKLLAQGLIDARRQRGFFVRDVLQKSPVASSSGQPSADEELSAVVNPAPPLGVRPPRSSGGSPTSSGLRMCSSRHPSCRSPGSSLSRFRRSSEP